ncbi:hypothetical protein LZC95_20425 [Pendulispora brunnea]|uniref:Uncharacterized protein n=1 Tax=Pendulispora brunnea TaxID=2905690 RepID=A0ABZ2KKV2_9BACT
MSGVYSFELEFDALVTLPATLERHGPRGGGIVRISELRDEAPPDELGVHYVATGEPAEDPEVPTLAYALQKTGLVGYGHLVTQVGAAPVWLAPKTSSLWLAAHQSYSHPWSNLPFSSVHNQVQIELDAKVTRHLERLLDGDPRHREFMRLLARGMERRARLRSPKFASGPKW